MLGMLGMLVGGLGSPGLNSGILEFRNSGKMEHVCVRLFLKKKTKLWRTKGHIAPNAI
jgi:hypothetical protein